VIIEATTAQGAT